MSSKTVGLARPSADAQHTDRMRRSRLLLVVLAAVVLADQATKWWAWRNSPGVLINPGGDSLVGDVVGNWYSDRLPGAALDLLDVVALSVAAWLLVRRPRPIAVLVPGAVLLAGWSSNVLDRLGLHFWTAPGSIRGAVDFIPLGSYVYNVADFFIASGTAVFVLVAGFLLLRRAILGLRRGVQPVWRAGLAAAALGLVGVVAFGAVHDEGVVAPDLPAGASASTSG